MVDKNILLISTGTGLAPMQGVIRDALLSNHRGNIVLYNESVDEQAVYNQQFLAELSQRYSNLYINNCISISATTNITTKPNQLGRADKLAFEQHADLTEWIVFSAGNANRVNATLQHAIQRGAAKDAVFGDPFEIGETFAASNTLGSVDTKQASLINPVTPTPSKLPADPHYPDPDPEMWQALGHGELLSKILHEFYSHVYNDDKLKGFFKNSTQQRAIEKQYSFLRKIFTGDDVYFGDRPRNAHHWMVISDALFDYREKLMENSLRKFSLAEHLITRWLAMEECYRKVIVKSKAWPKVVDGRIFPLEGFDQITMDVGALCDSCNKEIDPGDVVTYHVRLGTLYCVTCRNSESFTSAKP